MDKQEFLEFMKKGRRKRTKCFRDPVSSKKVCYTIPLYQNAAIFLGTPVGYEEVYLGVPHYLDDKGNGKGDFIHGVIIGRTGYGKSTLLTAIAYQAMVLGWGLVVFDPHGSLIRDVLRVVPPHRLPDVIVIDPYATREYGRGISLDILSWDNDLERQAIAEAIISAVKYSFVNLGDMQMKAVMAAAKLVVDAAADPSLKVSFLDFVKVFTDKKRRDELAKYLIDEDARAVLRGGTLDALGQHMAEKLSRLLSPAVSSIFRWAPNMVPLKDILLDGKIVLVHISKSAVGEDLLKLIFNLLARVFFIKGMSRERSENPDAPPILNLIDEAHNYDLSAMTKVFAEGRKFKYYVFLVFQHLGQLEGVNVTIFNDLKNNAWVWVVLNTVPSNLFPSRLQERAGDIESLPRYHSVVLYRFFGETKLMTIRNIFVNPEKFGTDPDKVVRLSLLIYGYDARDLYRESSEALSPFYRRVMEALPDVFSIDSAVQMIAEKLGVSVSAARKYLSSLVDMGVVECDPQGNCTSVISIQKQRPRGTGAPGFPEEAAARLAKYLAAIMGASKYGVVNRDGNTYIELEVTPAVIKELEEFWGGSLGEKFTTTITFQVLYYNQDYDPDAHGYVILVPGDIDKEELVKNIPSYALKPGKKTIIAYKLPGADQYHFVEAEDFLAGVSEQ